MSVLVNCCNVRAACISHNSTTLQCHSLQVASWHCYPDVDDLSRMRLSTVSNYTCLIRAGTEVMSVSCDVQQAILLHKERLKESFKHLQDYTSMTTTTSTTTSCCLSILMSATTRTATNRLVQQLLLLRWLNFVTTKFGHTKVRLLAARLALCDVRLVLCTPHIHTHQMHVADPVHLYSTTTYE
jgi:hypothetical protein